MSGGPAEGGPGGGKAPAPPIRQSGASSGQSRPGAGPEPPVKRQRPSSLSILKRPGFGTKGSKVELICNHFKVDFKPSDSVSHYNVTIEPPSKNVVNRKVMAALHVAYGKEFLRGKRFAYDGEKSLFIVGSYDLNRHEFPVTLEDEPGRFRPRAGGAQGSRPENEFMVTLARVGDPIDMRTIEGVMRGERDVKAQEALRVLDIVLREHASLKGYLLLKDSYFHQTIGAVHKMGEGVDLWRGYHVSFRPTSGGLSLNFDVATTLVIRPLPVLDFLTEHCKKPVVNFREEDWAKSRRILKGIQVVVDYSGRKHKINGFSPEPCNRQMFPKRMKKDGVTVDETENVTVVDYFLSVRNLKLKYPQYRALDVGRGSKPCYFPLELCTILPGQKYKRALSTAQRQAQIDQTRQFPAERMRLIQEVMNVNKYNDDELVKEFNIMFDPKMKAVSGRVLEPPKLMFGNRFEETPRNGRWNFGAKTMKTPANIPNWCVVTFKGRMTIDGRKVGTELQTVCNQKGMKLGEFTVIDEDVKMKLRSPLDRVNEVVNKVQEKFEKFLAEGVEGDDRAFILAILPEKSPEIYIPFKRKCEVELGIVTQCIVPPKGQVNPKYLTSVSLKINLKRGGYNSVLSSEEMKTIPKISQVPTIIFGLDVSHGSPGDANSPSVAAAVATVDWPRVSRYTTSIRAQPSKTEVIEGLYEATGGHTSGMVRELLLNFYKFGTKKVKPEQIVIFRDGVSESQFDEVLEKELTAFKRSCKSMDASYNPKVTFIVVQKRHHTRFFPARPSGNGNIVPGTIVDMDPCHPRNYDFYLCSHAGLIGTSRPTHYHVLYDEIGFSPDELQNFTNSLCYSYTRCTSAVSVVAPAYYAHLAAQHCRNFVLDTWDSESDSSSRAAAKIEKAISSLPKLKDTVMKKMFYA